MPTTGAHHTEIVSKLQQLEIEQAVMKDLFNRAVRSSPPTSGDSKLNVRQAERHVPKEFSGKSGGYAEFVFKIEAYMSTLDPAGKGGETIRVAVTEIKDNMIGEVRTMKFACWNVPALNGAGLVSYHHHHG